MKPLKMPLLATLMGLVDPSVIRAMFGAGPQPKRERHYKTMVCSSAAEIADWNHAVDLKNKARKERK